MGMFDDLIKPKGMFDELLKEPNAPKPSEFLDPLEVVIMCSRTKCVCGEVYETPMATLPLVRFPRRAGGSVFMPSEVAYPGLPHRVEFHDQAVGACQKCLGALQSTGELFPTPKEDPITRWRRMHQTAVPVDPDTKHQIEARAAKREELTSYEHFVIEAYIKRVSFKEEQ